MILNIDRPKIKVPLESIDIIMESISIVLIFLMWLYLLTEYPNLPETVASHFNIKGEPDAYNDKTFILLLPSIATLMYFGLFLLNRYPHIHNYMVNITPNNALKNYRFSTRIVRIVNTLSMIMFSYITFHIINSAKGKVLTLGNWFLPIVIGVSIILPIFIIIYFRKINKT